MVEAGFEAADLLNLVQILPTTCTTGTAVAAATSCFTTNAEACNCFDEAFLAPDMPSVLPTTCAEAGGDMTEVVCAMMECCPPCSDAVTGLWNCVADGTDTIDKDTCSVVCPAADGSDASDGTGESPPDGTDESPSEGIIDFPGFDDLPGGCEEAGQDLKACIEGLDEGVLGTAMTCMRNEASAKMGGGEGGLPTSKCAIIETVTCAVRSCVPNSECLLEVMDAQNCAAGSDLGCDLNCDRGRDTDYATPPPSAGEGDGGDLPMDDPFKLLAPECRPLAEEVGTCLEGLEEEGCEACVETETEGAMKSLIGDLMKDDTSGVLGLIFGGMMEGMEGGAEGGRGTTPVAMGRMSENGEEGDEMMPMFDEGVLENFFCTMAGNVVCATKDCCPTCAAQVDDVVACVKRTGGIEIPDLAAVMGDFTMMNGGGTTDIPDRSVSGGEMTPEEEPPTKMISCDISCDGAAEPKGDESTTAATTAATASPQGGGGAATTAAPVDLDVAATTTTEAPGTDGLGTLSGTSRRSAAVATLATVGGLLLAVA